MAMVLILVLVTFTILIVVTWLLSSAPRAETEGASVGALRASPATAPAADLKPAAYLHPGHVWVRLAPDGIASVGASDFAANFAGALSGVEVPEAGARLRQGEPAWTLVSGKNRRLTQAMPLDGEVVEVNRDLARRTNGRGVRAADWILRVRPARLAENLRNLFRGSLADAWQELAGARLNAALAPALGRVANDGGVWLENFGDLLNDSDWHALREDLFPPERGAAAR
jgi:glycine cleavage system H lipoate-binding protein